MCAFTDTQSKRINNFETGSVMFKLNSVENIFDFLSAENNREFFLLFRSDKFKICPFSFEGQCKKLLDATKSNS